MIKYNLCSACVWFRPKIMTAERVIPAHCERNMMSTKLFNVENKGYVSGIDIIHCDQFQQFFIDFADFKVLDDDGIHGLSYILTAPSRLIRRQTLYNNEKNIKIIPYE